MIRNKNRRPFEFQRNGPIARPAGHKPDFSLVPNTKTPRITKRSAISPRKTSAKKYDNILDTLFLVELVGKTDISSIKHVDGSGKKLTGVDISTLRELCSLVTADFSDNKLPLEPFAVLPKLKELDLSCNMLKSFNFQSSEKLTEESRAWPALETLNLSFNDSSAFISELQMIPRLTNLNLSQNSISNLPTNLMHFTCLTHLNLSGNKINSDQNFYALATIASLQVLVLDNNQITSIPEFNFGFEALQDISLKGNEITYPEDISSLATLASLETINIANNPIVLRSRNLRELRKIIDKTTITLNIEEKPNKVVKRSLPPQMRTVNFDPLTLPSFTKQHKRALNLKKQDVKNVQVNTEEKSEDVSTTQSEVDKSESFFLTETNATSESEDKISVIEPTPIPIPLEEPDYEEQKEITSIWDEVPVMQASERVQLKASNRSDFILKFKKLEFLVAHPDLRLRPRESPSGETEEEIRKRSTKNIDLEEDRSIMRGTSQLPTQKKKPVQEKIAARTEYTKTEVQQMLRSMADRLGIVERDLGSTDETGQKAVDLALDQKNFSTLQKQYETIRAELINTLNSV